jgi:hypothetical protein
MAIIKCKFSKQLEKFDSWLDKQYLQIKVFFHNKFNKNKRLFLYEDNKINGVLKIVPYYDSNNVHIGYDINISYFLFKETKNELYRHINTFKKFKIFYSTSLNDNTQYESFLQLRLRYFLKPEDKKFPKNKFLNDFNKYQNLFLRYVQKQHTDYPKYDSINNLIKDIKFEIFEYAIRENESVNLSIWTSWENIKIHLNRFGLFESLFGEPAFTHEDRFGLNYCKQYYKNGKLHREDGPAVINTFSEKEEKFYINGLLHNEDNAAIVKNSSQKYYLYGKEIKPNRFKLLLLTRFQKSSKIYFNFE